MKIFVEFQLFTFSLSFIFDSIEASVPKDLKQYETMKSHKHDLHSLTTPDCTFGAKKDRKKMQLKCSACGANANMDCAKNPCSEYNQITRKQTETQSTVHNISEDKQIKECVLWQLKFCFKEIERRYVKGSFLYFTLPDADEFDRVRKILRASENDLKIEDVLTLRHIELHALCTFVKDTLTRITPLVKGRARKEIVSIMSGKDVVDIREINCQLAKLPKLRVTLLNIVVQHVQALVRKEREMESRFQELFGWFLLDQVVSQEHKHKCNLEAKFMSVLLQSTYCCCCSGK